MLRKAIPTEKEDHKALVQWLNIHPILKDFFLHIPNGGTRVHKTIMSKSGKKYTYSPEGVELKRMGVRAGVSDFLIAYPTKRYHGLWIELKPKIGGKLSPDQKLWLDRMNNIGFKAIESHGFDEAVYQIKCYLGDVPIEHSPFLGDS